MPAHVKVIGYGRTSSTICETCGIVRVHDRTENAQADAREHNLDHHPESIPPDTEETR